MFSKKLGKFALLCLLMVALVAAGCGQSGDQDATQNDTQEEEQGTETLSGNIQLAGSTSVQPLAEELANVFMEKNPGVKIDVQGGGSGAGIKAAAEGVANIGMSSRELKEDEGGLGLVPTVIAKDGIAVIVNSANKVEGLTKDQIKGIFTGEITNWEAVGGDSAPIVVINREEGSGTRDAFQELVLGADAKFTDSAAIQNSTGAVRTAVSSDANAVGFISLGSLDDSVKAVKVDGVEASEENVIATTYTISRPFLFLTKGEPTDLAKAFTDWVLSAEGQEVVGEEFIAIN
ncbi:phosphate ABC transporter substrate-binding protein [Candidatus Formimonas warabiya]|uniref:Phosphate-binding protein n=1 Tax=Formimonas warabiya TaxID=1761012 RepID=A0A3G1KN34_FORW1|nr:phosphate ABC transporter substrate-binding protein [Candidatus Formimonas warabiya]ATW23869.1 phosphate-binding protein [Candidatus Formimonas warabiya]